MKIILTLLLAFSISAATSLACAKAKDQTVSVEGIAEEAKDGLYVDGIRIGDDALEKKGKTRSEFVGKKVKVTGTINEVTSKDPNEGKDPRKDLMVQSRVGTWKAMEKIESIMIIP